MTGEFSFDDKQKIVFDDYTNFGCLSQNQNLTLPWNCKKGEYWSGSFQFTITFSWIKSVVP